MPALKTLHLPRTIKFKSIVLRHLPRDMAELGIVLHDIDESDLAYIRPKLTYCGLDLSIFYKFKMDDYWPVQCIPIGVPDEESFIARLDERRRELDL